MSNVKTLQRSFGGGEVTPEFFGRIDDPKYQTGAATMKNFIALPHGPIQNRTGFELVRAAGDSTRVVRLIPFTFSTDQTMVLEFGHLYIRFHTQGATLLSGASPYQVTTTYTEADLFDLHYVQSADVMTIVHPNYAPAELRRISALSWTLTNISFASSLSAPGAPTVTPTGTGSTAYLYKVTSVGADGLEESVASASGTANNNLLTTGNYNTITWTTTSASRYNVYKQSNGLYGYIGQTDALTFKDDNIFADVAKTPPIVSNPFSGAGLYPGAVSYFEQRRCFAGSTNEPQNIRMTRSGTESNLNYSIPSREDDAINIRVAAREANIIRHIVPLQNMVLLTGAAEWRVTSVNSDAITPTSVSVKPQSYVGANNVQPLVVNNNIIYAAARGGHMREMAYNYQAGGYITGDLSLRAPHLFSYKSITDMAYAKAPFPIIWAVSSGTLLGFTYVPEQQVGAWHQHETDGTFESCCVVPEDDEDRLYAVVLRGSTRYVERMASRENQETGEDMYLDSSLSYWKTGTYTHDGSTITCAIAGHGFSSGSYNFVLNSDRDAIYTATITVTGTDTFTMPLVGTKPASGTVEQSITSLSGLSHLEGKTVSILGDGGVMPTAVVTGGVVTLAHAARRIKVGLPYTSVLKTLPLAMQIDGALGQGRSKNVNKVWLRVYRSSGIFVGPSEYRVVEVKQRTLEPYGTPPSKITDEVQVNIPPGWSASGQVVVEQRNPLPLTILSLSMEVALGG